MKRSDSILANFYNQELSKLPAFKNGGKKKKTPPVKKTPQQKIKYVDLEDTYDLDPFSKEGIEKARQLIKLNPNTRIVCDANGCSEIAVNAAEAYGYDYNRGHAWDLGNTNPVVATNPVYKNLIGKGILPDPNPKDYSAPATMFRPGSIIGLNRKNNLVGTKATSTDEADDSWDYANQTLYPKSRGYEHVGYVLDDKTVLHGTGAGPGHPAFYTIDTDLSNGLQLGNLATYQPVETIQQTPLQKKAEKKVNKGAAYNANPIAKIIRLFGFENGGMITDPRGQWKYPGMNTRIPGSNITMQGVSYPVLAQANNGMQTMMYPGQDYYFPGADYVDEYPMMSEGGLVKYQKKGQVSFPPIYTNDPDDYKRWRDSVIKNIEGLKRLEEARKDIKSSINAYSPLRGLGSLATSVSNFFTSDKTVYPKYSEKVIPYKKRWTNDPNENQPISDIEIGDKKFYDAFKPSTILGYSAVDDYDMDTGKNDYDFYTDVYQYAPPTRKNLQLISSKKKIENSKPEPEPTLKRKVSMMKPISTQSSYTPSLRIPNIPNIELPSVQRGKYRTSYWDPEMKDWNERAFMSQQESDQFANEMSQRGYPGSYGNVTQRVQYRDGGPKDGIFDSVVSKLNPFNWGVTDYSKSGSFKNAYSAALKNNEKEFMYNNKRYNTNYKGTEQQQLSATGITNNQRMNQNVFRKALRNIDQGSSSEDVDEGYNGYPNPFNALGDLLAGKKYNTEDDPEQTDMLNIYAGAPQKNNTLGVSKYKPTKIKENNTSTYYRVNPLNNKMPNQLTQEQFNYVLKNKAFSDYLPDFNSYVDEQGKPHNTYRGLGAFTLDAGKDDRGDYISYYDKWDLNPFSSGKNAPDLSLGVGKPYEVYDRIYYKDYGNGVKKRMYYNDNELSNLDFKSKNFDTKALQRELANRGYNLSKSFIKDDEDYDGVLGEETKKAYLDWKSKYKKSKKEYGGLVKYQRKGEVRAPIDLRLPSYQTPKSFVTGYGFSENPEPNVNIYGVGAYGERDINKRLNLSGNVNSASVFYPGGNKMFMKPNFNIGMKYKFQRGGDISIPNLRQAYYPMAYGGPMVRYMAGKMTGPNIF